MAKIMPALDFNALNHPDRLTAAYFEQAAAAIRKAEAEAGYWRRRCVAEEARGRDYRREADTLAMLLGRLLDQEDLPPTPESGESV